MFAAQGAMWERAGYPDQAVKSYEKFEKAQAQFRDARYTELARWEQGARVGAQRAVASLPHREAVVAPTDLALEKGLQSQILQARGSLKEAESLVNEAMALDPRSARLYLQRAGIYYAMADEARRTEDQLAFKADKLKSGIQKLEPGKDAAPRLPSVEAADQAKLQGLKVELAKTQEEAASYQAKANALYGKVIEDCNRVMAQLPRAADAYVYRAYASFFHRGRPQAPLESDDPILKDLRQALSIRQDRTSMDTLIYLLTGPDVSKLSENDPRLEEALRLGLERDRMFPGDARTLATLAELQYRIKHYLEADRSIEAAIRLEGDNYEYYETRAKIERELGRDELQVKRQLARGYRRAADILRWNEKAESAEGASEKSWEPMHEIAKNENNTEILCSPDISVCTENRVVAVSSDWILGAVESVVAGKGKTREVRIDRGSEDGIILLTKGDVYSLASEEEDGGRGFYKIGTGQVEAVKARTAIVRMTLDDPQGEGLVRPKDLFYLKARMPKGEERSKLWGLARFHIVLQTIDRKPILDYRTLYGRETAELDNKLYEQMIDDIHAAAKLDADFLKKKPEKGKFAGKTLGQALSETTRDDLERFFKYVLRFPAIYFGHELSVTNSYAKWVMNGTRDE
jgi:tetratricopeptide (TPR) repeat protein